MEGIVICVMTVILLREVRINCSSALEVKLQDSLCRFQSTARC